MIKLAWCVFVNYLSELLHVLNVYNNLLYLFLLVKTWDVVIFYACGHREELIVLFCLFHASNS